MWSASFVILLISLIACIAFADDTVEPEQCNGPPPFDHRMSPDSCCKKPIFKPDIRACMNKTRQIIMKRYQEARNTKNEDQTETEVSADEGCLANCFSTKNIFENDEINRDELIKVLETQTEDSAWTSIHSEAVDKCIEVLQPDLKNIQTSKSGHRCNRVAVRMMICLNGQYFVRCPDTHFQKDDESCKKFQEHIKTCPMPRGGPWGPGNGKKGFAGKRGGNFRSGFGPGSNFGPGPQFGSNFGPGPQFGNNFGPGSHFGHGPNFGTGEVFGFL